MVHIASTCHPWLPEAKSRTIWRNSTPDASKSQRAPLWKGGSTPSAYGECRDHGFDMLWWYLQIQGFPKMGVPQNGLFISWTTLLKWMIWATYFGKPPIMVIHYDLLRIYKGMMVSSNIFLRRDSKGLHRPKWGFNHQSQGFQPEQSIWMCRVNINIAVKIWTTNMIYFWWSFFEVYLILGANLYLRIWVNNQDWTSFCWYNLSNMSLSRNGVWSTQKSQCWIIKWW